MEFRELTKDVDPQARLSVSVETHDGECYVVDVSKVDLADNGDGSHELFLVAQEDHCDKCGRRNWIGWQKREKTQS